MINFATFDLNLLRVLDALLHDGSTVRAADRLNLSQPAVSSALARLRRALGDELFVRRGQGLEPTDFALSLREPLRAQLETIARLLNGPGAFDPRTSEARFTISGSDFFGELLMPPLAERLSRLAPGMRLHMVDLVPDNYFASLGRNDVDLALIPAMEPPPWAECQKVFRSPFVVIARSGHPRMAAAQVAPGMQMPIDLFCDLGHVLFSPEGNARGLGDAALARIGRTRRVVMSMPLFSGVYRAVAASDLIGLLPLQLARHVAASAGLAIYAAPMPVATAQLVMAWHRRHTASPAHVWLRAQIADLLLPLDVAEFAPA